MGSWTQRALRRRYGKTLHTSLDCVVNTDKHIHTFEQLRNHIHLICILRLLEDTHNGPEASLFYSKDALATFLVIQKTWRHLWNMSVKLKGFSKWSTNWSINNSRSFLHLGTCHDNLLDVASVSKSPHRQKPMVLFPFYTHRYTCVL